MAKTKQQKEEIIKELRELFGKQKSVFLINFQGLKSPEFFELREKIKKENGLLKVTKKTLLSLVLKEKATPSLLESIRAVKGEIALIFAFGDEFSPLKMAYQFSKENENLEIIGGIGEVASNGEKKYSFISAEESIKLAQLPSRNELLAEFVGIMKAPLYNFVDVLKGNIKGLLYILKEVKT